MKGKRVYHFCRRGRQSVSTLRFSSSSSVKFRLFRRHALASFETGARRETGPIRFCCRRAPPCRMGSRPSRYRLECPANVPLPMPLDASPAIPVAGRHRSSLLLKPRDCYPRPCASPLRLIRPSNGGAFFGGTVERETSGPPSGSAASLRVYSAANEG